MLKKIKSSLVVTVLLTGLLFAPQAQAGLWDSAASYFSHGVHRVSNWWQKGSIGLTKSQEDPSFEEEPAEETEETMPPDDDAPATTTAPGMCRVPQEPPVIICEMGSGFLCVNTPEAGVADDFIIIKGTVDRRGSTPADMSIAAQHEYTKETTLVDTSDPETEDCWSSPLVARPFCLDTDGFYAARVPLSEKGPYTVSVSATRFSGGPAAQSVRTSRVMAPQMGRDNVEFAPDVQSGNQIQEEYITVTVSLLGDCQFCDFIGAATSAVTVTVENQMRDSLGNTSSISCSTNIEQGGQGRFVVGVPVGPHQNQLTVTACNAAAEGSSCPAISGITFTGPGGITGFKIIKPPPQPSYSSARYPSLSFEFEIEGLALDTCVDVTFNRQPAVSVCPAADGSYSLDLYPQEGINIVTVEYKTEALSTSFPWVFGWGKISSPFSEGGSVKDNLVSEAAVQLALPAQTVTDLIGPFISNVLSADEVALLIEKFAGDQDSQASPPAEEEEEEIVIPQCSEEAGLEGFTIKLLGEPSIGAAKMEGISFEKDVLKMSLNADDLLIGVGLVKDGDGDGQPDGDVVPLKISLKKAIVDLMLQVEPEEDLVILGAPHTDCDFKNDRYCRGTPAALIPQNMVGNASRFGHFVRCEATGDEYSGEVKEFCEALNSLNAQTGLISEKVLDAVNSLIYCGGSKALTRLARDGISRRLKIDGGSVLGNFTLPVGFSLKDGVEIDKKGLLLTAALLAGDGELFSQMPAEAKMPSVGVISRLPERALRSADANGSQLRLALAADALNHLLFVLMSVGAERQGEVQNFLDFEISEPFFNRTGFDFVYKCDAFLENEGREGGTPSALCNLRPRVSELLGTPLTRYGYFPAKHPLLVKIQANSALPPHISVVSQEEIPVVAVQADSAGSYQEPLADNLLDIQLGGIVASFYALEVDESVPLDEYGNLAVKLNADGRPIIRSMRPSDSDPYRGQIASFEIALLLAVEIGDVKTDPNDPSQYEIMVRLMADRSRLVISPVPGTNATTIPPASLIGALREKLQYAINIYSARENAIRISIPKAITFSSEEEDLFTLLGLKKISFDQEGLGLTFDTSPETILLDVSAVIEQLLHQGGQEISFTLPH